MARPAEPNISPSLSVKDSKFHFPYARLGLTRDEISGAVAAEHGRLAPTTSPLLFSCYLIHCVATQPAAEAGTGWSLKSLLA